MKKILFAMVASLATLIATGSGVNAAFTVTMSFPGFTGTASVINAQNTGGANSQATANGVGPVLGQLDTSTQTIATLSGNKSVISLQDGVAGTQLGLPSSGFATEQALLITSSQTGFGSGTINNALVSLFTLTNDHFTATGVVIPTVTITIKQDAYTFSGLENQLSSLITVGNTTGSFSGTTVAYTVTATNGVNTSTISAPTFTLAASGLASNASGYGPISPLLTGTGSITQTFTITNLQIGQHISFNPASASVSTPLPATALMAGLAFPLLGLAGAARRRLFA